MKTISSYDAKAQFAALIKLVEQGESVIVTRHGKPVVRMEAVKSGIFNRQQGPLPKELRANCPVHEAIAPLHADIPWSDTDPV